MDLVHDRREEIVITKHRKPVAKLVPIDPPEPFLNRSPGVIEAVGDIVGPTSPDWEVDADL